MLLFGITKLRLYVIIMYRQKNPVELVLEIRVKSVKIVLTMHEEEARQFQMDGYLLL
jgi:hypothetical protein